MQVGLSKTANMPYIHSPKTGIKKYCKGETLANQHKKLLYYICSQINAELGGSGSTIPTLEPDKAMNIP